MDVELIREFKGVGYYYDSSGISPEKTTDTLQAFDQKIILIAGGYDEKPSYENLGQVLVDKVRHLILIGQTAALIELVLFRHLKGKNACNDVRITHCSTLEQAVYAAFFSAKPGDKVVLSPAASSLGMFISEEDRGSRFRDLVNSLS